MRLCLSLIASILLICACDNRNIDKSQEDVLVHIGDKNITRADIAVQMPKGLTSADSLIRAESLVKKMVISTLMDNAAYKNVGGDKNEIERLVGEYRRSLIRHRYQEKLVNDKVSADISVADQIAYYEENKAQFVLGDNLIKGLFLKAPVDAPNLNEVRKWYVSETEESLEKIEKYSIQNAITYDLFYDRWVNFDEVMTKIPQRITDATRFLSANDHLEVSDSTYVYFLNISDKRLVGGVAPFDYVGVQIRNMMANKRKIDYLREFGEDLYRSAVNDGVVKFIKE